MKKYLMKVVAVMGIISLLTSFFACQKKNNQNNFKKETINFSSLSQEERQDYVKDYLKKNYDMDCTLTEIKKRQITAVKNEENYRTVATFNNFWFTVWIAPQVEIIDTAFTYYIKDDVNKYFEKILKQNGIDCSVYDRFLFDDLPTKKWNANEVEAMFHTENIWNNIHLYGVEKETDLETIGMALKDFYGAVYIHYDKLELENLNFDEYDEFVDLN